ncbi:leucine-rich repeat-containing protein 51-like isoform X2 [Littorina saxatilis]|uniref:Leucine-rich repeat-containing protein 51 n=1 Tax=Littorina saxatilis TaxID=31220 RepID=A0AAN9B2B8_9CAEN
MADMSAAVRQKRQDELDQKAQNIRHVPGTTDSEVEIPAPLDYSFLALATIEDAEKEDPRIPMLGKVVSPKGTGKFAGRCLRMNNNQLAEIKTLKAFVTRMFVSPLMIGWLDLSFNCLTVIDNVLLEFPNLEILYLHGNNISNIKEVDKLAKLTKLRKLTLHGNAVENEKGYRLYVLSTIPWLRNFDFSAVTKCEAKTADTWRRLNNASKKKKKTQAGED